MSPSQIAQRYAKVLLSVALEQNALEDIRGDLAVIHEAILKSWELKSFLANPLFSTQEQQSILKAVFEGKISGALLNFCLFLAYKGRLNLLKSVAESFDGLYLAHKKIVPLTITSSVLLPEDQKENLRRHLRARTGQTIQDQYVLRPEILGGARVQIGDFVYDGTVRTQLEKFKHSIINV